MNTVEKVNFLKIKQTWRPIVGRTYSVEISIFPVQFTEKSDLSI